MALAQDAGATIVARPQELCGDLVPDLPVLEHALSVVGAMDNDVLVLLRPTAPFRTPDDIERAIDLMRQWPEVSSLRSVILTPAHPRKTYRGVFFAGLPYTVLLPYSPQHAANEPRQSLEPVYKAVGYVDVIRCRWIYAGSCEGPLIGAYPIDEWRAVDLDSETDWAAAERLVAERGWTPGSVE